MNILAISAIMSMTPCEPLIHEIPPLIVLNATITNALGILLGH